MKTGLIFMGMGFELVGLIVMSIYLGQEIDKVVQSGGYVPVGLMLLGLAGWMFHLIVLLKRYQAVQKEQERSEQ